jgi:hypothetical protein
MLGTDSVESARWVSDRPSVGAGEVSELMVAFPRSSAALTLAITPAAKISLLGISTSVNG